MTDNNKKLVIENVKIIFAELKDKEFGSRITIDVTDKAIQDQITKWGEDNGVSVNFKDYTNEETGETTKQYSMKLAQFVNVVPADASREDMIEGIDALAEKGLRSLKIGRGAEVKIVASSYEYENKFGKGVSASVTALRVNKCAEFTSDSDLLFN